MSLMENWEDCDNISKLLRETATDTDSFNTERTPPKSLEEEFLEVGECLSVGSFNEVPFRKQSSSAVAIQNESSHPQHCTMFKDKKLSSTMTEFFGLSKIMDRNIAQYQVKAVREQKESLKERGKIHALQELLFTKHDKLKETEAGHQRKEREDKQKYDREIKSLKEELEKQKKDNEKLQNEFNRNLDAREQEIEELLTENTDLRNEVAVTTKEFEELAWENEELAEKVEIKDEYIDSLRFQMNMLEKQHKQDQWKLEQGDDILEMVEQERDRTEEEYKKKMSKLIQQIQKDSAKREKDEYLEVEVTKPSSGDRQCNISGISISLLPVESQREPQQDKRMFDSAVAPAAESQASLPSHEIFKSASLSSSTGNHGNVSVRRRKSIQRKSSIDIAKMDKIPVVLRSLGWDVDYLTRQH